MYCRTKWDFGTEGKKEVQVEEESNDEGYMNLGRMVGVSAVRGMLLFLYRVLMGTDTSTYHYQSWRQKHWH